MAVIKIVPMPGAEGQQGETGAVGPQGPQGDTGATGPLGADAVWYYNGEYNPGASYVIGDVVTYDGQLWYRKNANGGNVGDTPSEGPFWDLLAAKGQSNLYEQGTWETNFYSQNEIVNRSMDGQTLSSLGTYRVIGDIVFWDVHLIGFPNEETSPNHAWSITAPPFEVAPLINININGYVPTLSSTNSFGRLFIRADAEPYYDYTSGVPFGPDESVVVPIWGNHQPVTNNSDFISIYYQDPNDININTDTFKPVTCTNIVNLLGESEQNATLMPYFRFNLSGWYRKA